MSSQPCMVAHELTNARTNTNVRVTHSKCLPDRIQMKRKLAKSIRTPGKCGITSLSSVSQYKSADTGIISYLLTFYPCLFILECTSNSMTLYARCFPRVRNHAHCLSVEKVRQREQQKRQQTFSKLLRVYCLAYAQYIAQITEFIYSINSGAEHRTRILSSRLLRLSSVYCVLCWVLCSEMLLPGMIGTMQQTPVVLVWGL